MFYNYNHRDRRLLSIIFSSDLKAIFERSSSGRRMYCGLETSGKCVQSKSVSTFKRSHIAAATMLATQFAATQFAATQFAVIQFDVIQLPHKAAHYAFTFSVLSIERLIEKFINNKKNRPFHLPIQAICRPEKFVSPNNL